MASASAARLTTRQRADLDALAVDLRRIFESRLQSLVVYGLHGQDDDQLLRTLALVEQLSFEDLSKCVPLTSTWHRRGLAVPLLLPRHEFFRSLDVFPLEYGDIIGNHVVIAGDDPFGSAIVAEADRRRGCEQQAKSHLIHLREGFLETEGHAREIVWLISASAAPFRTLLANIARLEYPAIDQPSDETLAAFAEARMAVRASLVTEVLSSPYTSGTIADPTVLLSRYIEASERIWMYVDGWRS